MKLYHGTAQRFLSDIQENGLTPRGEDDSNWLDHPSRSDCVYLTTAYAGYFAHAATEEDDSWAIIRVDTDKVPGMFLPDEDFVEQALTMGQANDFYLEILQRLSTSVEYSNQWPIKKRVAHIRANLEVLQDLWSLSVERMGTCCHLGSIPVTAIDRIGIYDPKSSPALTLTVLDPSISITNFQFCQSKYEALTRWLCCENVTPLEMLGDLFEPVREQYDQLSGSAENGTHLEQWEKIVAQGQRTLRFGE